MDETCARGLGGGGGQGVDAATRPVVVVAHSLGVPTFIHAIPEIGDKVKGAFLVTPPDVSNPKIRPKHLMTFGPYPLEPFTFPSIVVASRNDHYCSYEVADELAASWGSMIIDAGDSGHLNSRNRPRPLAGRFDGFCKVSLATLIRWLS